MFFPQRSNNKFFVLSPLIGLFLYACSNVVEETDSDLVITKYKISANVFGLSSGVLVLTNNGGNELVVTAADLAQDPVVTFSNQVNEGQNYEVTVANHPVGQKCSVVNGSGVALDDVSNIQVGCFSEIIATVESLSGKAILSWNVESAQKYIIYQSSDFDFSDDPNFPDAVRYLSVTSPYEVAPLTNGNTYYMVVVAYFSGGHFIASDPVLVEPNRSAIEQFGTVGAVDWGLGLLVDGSGDLFLTGNSGGPFVDANSNLGGQDIIIMKFASTGEELWRTQSGSTGEEYGRSIALDSSGNIFVAGETGGDFGGAPTDDGLFNKYLAKYNPSGGLLWSMDLGTGRATAVIVDDNDNVVVTGKPCSVTLFDNDGQEQWNNTIGDASTGCNALAIDSNNNIYTIGATFIDLDGPGSNQGDYDFFISKYNDNDGQQNLVQLGSVSTDYGYSIDLDGNGNIYVSGMTGGIIGDNFTKDIPQADVFVMKLDNNLNKIWAFQYDAGPTTYGTSLKVDSLGNSYVAGKTGGAFPGYQNAGTPSGEDIFILKLDNSGGLTWAKQYGTTESDVAAALAIDEVRGLVYATGYTYGVLGSSGFANGDVVLITEPM